MKSECFVRSLAVFGVVLNIYFACNHIYEYLSSSELLFKEHLLSFAVLELGWAVLLSWFLNDIYQRKEIMAFYIIPLLGINIAHSIHSVLVSQWSVSEAVVNILYGAVFSSLFLLGYMKILQGAQDDI